MSRQIKVGDMVRVLTKQFEDKGDSRGRIRQYSVARVESISDLETKGTIVIKTTRLSVSIPVSDVELVRGYSDLDLSDVLDGIKSGTYKEDDVFTVKGEQFIVFKDEAYGLGLKQLTSETLDANLLYIPAQYVNRSFISPVSEEKTQLSLEDLKLRFGTDIEIVD